MTPAVSVVVPTRNRCDTLRHVLPALAAQTLPPDAVEILLCDAGSDDGTAQMVTQLALPNLRVVTCGGGGRGPARNAGIRSARGAIVVFNDADILADPELVERHVQAHRRRAGSAIVGCEVQVDSLEEYEAVRADPSRRRTLHRSSRRRLSWLFFLTGNASVPRDLLLRAGMFDERMTAYGHEDLDLGYRLQRLGVPIRYEPRAVSYHWHPQTLDDRLAKMESSGRATIGMYRRYRDARILLRMGVNPISWGLHAVLARKGGGERWTRRASASPLARTIALQMAYLAGAKAEWRAVTGA